MCKSVGAAEDMQKVRIYINGLENISYCWQKAGTGIRTYGNDAEIGFSVWSI